MPTLLLGCGGGDLNDLEGLSAPAVSVREPAVIPQALSAEQLADILDVAAWTWTYRGPAPVCWIEIVEEGQETLPARIPAEGGVGAELSPPATGPRQGTILFYWRELEPGGGGLFHLSVDGRGVHNYGIPADAFLFGWRGWGARISPTQGAAGEPIEAEPGEERLLLTYEAHQVPEGGGLIGQGTPQITVRLKARFPDPSATEEPGPEPQPESPTPPDEDPK